MTDYTAFLQSKIDIARESGFSVSPGAVNPALKPHQRDAVLWAIRGGAHQFGRILEDGAWKRVRSVTQQSDQETWSIQVADDASYTAEGCIVKNCPLQIDIVERLLNRYSNPGDTILDPFGGIMTVPTLAVKHGRKGIGVELNPDYFRDGVAYLREADEQISSPTLLDLLGIGD